MNLQPLMQFVNGPIIGADPILYSLISEAAARQDVFFYVCDLDSRQLIYASPSGEDLLGYSANEFMKGGANFFYGITDPERIPAIIERQQQYTQLSKINEFDPRTIIIQEYNSRMITGSGPLRELFCMATTLTYTPDGDWEYGVAFLMQYNAETEQECRSTLTAIKKRHNEVYTHPRIIGHSAPLSVVHLKNERIDKKITRREAQVLSLIAEGQSSNQISTRLSITVNTVETFRKNLLEKFKSKNTAELIKNASKVFWL